MWQEVVKVKELLNLPRHISILSHRNPDGDALGSTIALALFLQSFGHKISIILPSEYPVYFEWDASHRRNHYLRYFAKPS
jgi:phosphoesterase RecJ-like protein